MKHDKRTFNVINYQSFKLNKKKCERLLRTYSVFNQSPKSSLGDPNKAIYGANINNVYANSFGSIVESNVYTHKQ